MIKGKTLMAFILISATLFGAVLWYYTQVGHYQRVNGLGNVIVNSKPRNVSNYKGLDGSSSPLKLRACFDVDWAYKHDDEYSDIAAPLVAPFWFGCFDAAQISADLANKKARAILASDNQPFGFSRFIAHYPDGRAFMWRQINICGRQHFAGHAMPAECPVPDTLTADKRVMIDPNSDLFTLKATTLNGVDLIPLPITGNSKIAAGSNGHNFHACFATSSSHAFLSETFIIAKNPNPPAPRGIFDCFDHTQISADLESGKAIAVLGKVEIVKGFDRIIAIYPDGTAFAWHQEGGS